MDWLGGLSSIKGQITNLTKDLLAEGTSEIQDPVAELLLAKNRISDLEQIVEAQKSEIKTIRVENQELIVQLESSQLRFDHAKENFQIQLAEKEAIILKLRTRVSTERGEPEGQPEILLKTKAVYGDTHSNIVSESENNGKKSSKGDDPKGWEDSNDEVVQLRAELAKWKRTAKKRQAKPVDISSIQSINTELEKQISDLKQQLLDAEEIRRNELAAMQENHAEHLSNLMEQLRETETEVVNLRKQIEQSVEANTQKLSEVNDREPQQNHYPDSPENSSSITISEQNDKPIQLNELTSFSESTVPKLQRGGKKKKKRQLVLPTSPKKLTEPTYVVQFQESATQIDSFELKDQSVETIDLVKIQDNFTEMESIQSKSISLQTHQHFEALSIEIQTDADLYPLKISNETSSIGVQFSPDNIKNISYQHHHFTKDRENSSSNHDDHSQISDLSDASLYSKQLDDLVHQLANEMETYENVVDQVVSTVMKQENLQQKDNITTTNDNDENQNSDLKTNAIEIAHKLTSLQMSLRTRRESIAELRLRKSKAQSKHRRNKQTINPPNEVDDSNYKMTSSVSIPDPQNSDEIADATEIDLDGWQDDDFLELNSSKVNQIKCPNLSSMNEQPKDKTYLRHFEVDSPEKLISHIRDLESMLSSSQTVSTNRIRELEQHLELADSLEKAIQSALSHLLATGSPSLYQNHLINQDDYEIWPPTSPEDQLAVIVAAGIVSRDQVAELTQAFDQLQEAYEQIQRDNHSLYERLEALEQFNITNDAKEKNEPDTENVNKIEGDLNSLAHKLIILLDPTKECDYDQWEFELYKILKERFNADNINDQFDSAEQLKLEINQLHKKIEQHNLFQIQAEQDLKHLLSTIQSQQQLIENLTNDNKKLENLLNQDNTEKNIILETNQNDVNLTQQKDLFDQLVNRVLEMYGHFYNDGNQNDNHTTDIDPSSINISKIIEILDLSMKKFTEVNLNFTNLQQVYNSVVVNLQQKHLESQTYHEQLQNILIEFAKSNQYKEELESKIKNLEEKLQGLEQSELESATKDIVKDSQAPSGYHNEQLNPNDNETKLMTEIQRLQAHLIEVEETYTAEALASESREVELRNRLKITEELIQKLQNLNSTSDDRINSAYSERDSAITRLEACRREIADLKESLANLQTVLDNFQRNQEAAVISETERIRSELNRALKKETHAQSEIERLNGLLDKQATVLEEMKDVHNQIKQYKDQAIYLETKMKQRDSDIETLRTRLAKMAADTDSRIDKTLIRNLLISYFQLSPNQRPNGLRVIGSLLDFADEDYAKVGSPSGALPKLISWVRNAVASLPTGPPKDMVLPNTDPNKSFSELLLAFLEQESAPRSPIKLSTDYYRPDAIRPTHINKSHSPNNDTANVHGDHFDLMKQSTDSSSLVYPTLISHFSDANKSQSDFVNADNSSDSSNNNNNNTKPMFFML